MCSPCGGAPADTVSTPDFSCGRLVIPHLLAVIVLPDAISGLDTPIIHSLVRLVEPWKAIYDHSTIVSTAVMGAHLVALLFSGGLAVASDRSTLRAMRLDESTRLRQLGELRAVHRPILIGLGLSFITGLLLAAADLATFLGSAVFWAKLGLVVVLLINGGFLARTEMRLAQMPTPSLWRQLRRSSWASLALWTATVVVGVVLTVAA